MELNLDELRATYDHPTDRSVIELIDRLEQAERDLVAVRGSQKKLAKQLVATRSDQGKAEWRANNAEQVVERVRTLTNELSWSPNHVAIVQRYRDVLDGEERG